MRAVVRGLLSNKKSRRGTGFRGALTFLTSIGLTAWLPAHGQVRVTIDERPACPRCSIDIVHVATLKPPEPADRFFHHISVAQDSAGRFLVSPGVDPSEVLVYSPTGRLVATFGRKGSGPGEYLLAERVLVGAGDSIMVFDGLARRMTTLSPALRVIRAIPIGLRVGQAVRLGASRLVIEAQVSTPSAFGLPLHMVEADARVSRSFGADPTTTIPPGERLSLHRRIAPASDRSVWSAYVDRYELEEWDTSGTIVRTLERKPPWFAQREAQVSSTPDQERPAPLIRAIGNGSEGRVWILTHIAREDWKRATPDAVEVVDGLRLSLLPSRLDRYVDTVVDLIDPKAGSLIATSRLRLALAGFVRPNRAYAHSEGANGEETIKIFDLRLIRN